MQSLARRLLLPLAVAACGSSPPPQPVSNTAREAPAPEPSVTYAVEKRPDGGVIEVKGNRTLAESSVRDYMSAKCGRNAYRVEREEQLPYQLTDGQPAIAWRIYYSCAR